MPFHYSARWYDSPTKRFVSRNPIQYRGRRKRAQIAPPQAGDGHPGVRLTIRHRARRQEVARDLLAALERMLDSRELIVDLKEIYQAATALEAEEQLAKFAAKWDEKYPTLAKQWRAKWPHIISMFDLPYAIHRATHTTNIIESINSVRRATWATSTATPKA